MKSILLLANQLSSHHCVMSCLQLLFGLRFLFANFDSCIAAARHDREYMKYYAALQHNSFFFSGLQLYNFLTFALTF